MSTQEFSLSDCRFEVLTDGDAFVGVGKVWIGDTLVRSGRLPIKPYTQSFTGHELMGLRWLGADEKRGELRLKVEASFRPMPVKLMRDHSFDPIHDTDDWEPRKPVMSGTARLDIVIRPAADVFNGVNFRGFSYHYDFSSAKIPLFYILDHASWELDGDIESATAVSQSSCSPPVAKFEEATSWTTEGILFFLDAIKSNRVMTHNLPRWASHGSFDFQYKGDATLIGVFERVELIRSVLQRDPRKAELKTFDKHIFDQTKKFTTSPKKILLNRTPKTVVGQKNIWTWIFEETDARARAEYGIREEPMVPFLFQNFWANFTVDSYYKDLLPAAIAIGARKMFTDNLKKSSMTEQSPLPGVFNWNMCCGHEYEISEKLGGNKRVKAFVEESRKHGVHPMCWTNNDQALGSPINNSERDDKNWFVRLEDARQKYGGAYAGVMSVLDMSVPAARDYFADSHIKITRETGLDAYFFDSFYNLGWMPITYVDCKPRTMWRGLLKAWKKVQDAGMSLAHESFGPWGQVVHGHPASYDIPNIFACYKVGVGNDYTTVPTGHPLKQMQPEDAQGVFYTLAHMAGCYMPLHFPDGRRIDQVWTDEHKAALKAYHDALPAMKRRYMQEDGKSVVWHDAKKKTATIWTFAGKTLETKGKVVDVYTGKALPKAGKYKLAPWRVYQVSGGALPTEV